MKFPFHKYIAEFIGTYMLAMMVSLSIISVAFPTPIAAGLTLGLFVYTLGSISGTHINPAVTIALWSIKKISSADAVWYIVAQLLGGLAALGKASWIFGHGALPELAPAVTFTASQFCGEAMGAFLLVFGISSVVHGRVDKAASGLVIGGSLLLGIYAASPFSLGALNPAVAIAIGQWNWMYLLGPILGGVIAAWVYRFLSQQEKMA